MLDLAVGVAEQRIVVVTTAEMGGPGRPAEREQDRHPVGADARGRGERCVHHIAVVQREVACGHGDRNSVRRADRSAVDERVTGSMRSGQRSQFACLGASRGETDRHHHRGTVRRVPAHSAIAVPRQVRKALCHVGDLPQHSHAVASVGVPRLQFHARRVCDALHAIVVVQPAERRAAHAVQHSRDHRLAPCRAAPPREPVARRRRPAERLGRGQQACHFMSCEDLSNHGEADHVEAVGEAVRCAGDGIDIERRGRVERCAVAAAKVHVLRVEQGSAVIHRPQRRLPPDEAQRVAPHHRRALLVEHRHRSVDIAGEPGH